MKPPQFLEIGHLEARLFSIQTRLCAAKHPLYRPPTGLQISDINQQWSILEAAENSREMALRTAMQNQGRVAQP